MLSPASTRSPNEAISRAELYARSIGIDLTAKLKPIVERLTSPNPGILSGDDPSGQKRRLREKLVGKDYWCVHYLPKQLQLGGEYAFFVEAETGSVLGFYAAR